MRNFALSLLLVTTLIWTTGCPQPAGEILPQDPVTPGGTGGPPESGQQTPPPQGDPPVIETPTETPPPVPQPEPEPGPTLVGTWKADTVGRMEIFGYLPVTFVEFDERGFVTIFHREESSGYVTCETRTYVDFGQALLSGYDTEYTSLALYDQPDDETLNITDDHLEEYQFTRVEEVPTDRACGTTEVLAEYSDLEIPHYASTLAFDGTTMWYTNEDGVARGFDLAGGAYSAMIQFSQTRYVQDVQNGAFWLGCYCSNDYFMLRDLNDVERERIEVDDYGADPDALAVDRQTGDVWVAARKDEDDSYVLQRYAGTPKQLFNEVKSMRTEALAHDGDNLWALRGDDIVRLDPLTGMALRTYQLAMPHMDWEGLVVHDGRVFVLGEDYRANAGLLLEVSLVD